MSTKKWYEGIQYDLDLVLDLEVFQFDWTDWLAEVGGTTLAAGSNIIVSTGLIVTGTVVASPLVTATFNCDTGTPPTVGDILKATCQAIAADGQKKARSINFKVVDKQ